MQDGLGTLHNAIFKSAAELKKCRCLLEAYFVLFSVLFKCIDDSAPCASHLNLS